MSNIENITESECHLVANCNSLHRVIKPVSKDLGGFCVKRILPSKELKSIGPWVFFDHMGPATFNPGEGVNVRPHPHIGLATVTYLLDGEIQHKDSLGTNETIKPGDINLMVAGNGIAHSERQTPEMIKTPHTVHGLQLWLALPKEHEQCQPSFHHYDADSLPTVQLGNGHAKILIGKAYGQSSPVKTFSNTLYVEVTIDANDSIQLPNFEELGLYIIKGSVKVDEFQIEEQNMAIFKNTDGIRITAEHNTKLVLLGGDAIGKRYIEWNFVSTDSNLIQEAKQKWANNGFPKVPGDENEYIPLP